MYASSSRPRVPSKAALRVLYQLAYISSGTAVAVAALCAEERRRRTRIVQKIADNAKRLRQSPRYNHHAALAVEQADDHGWYGFQPPGEPLPSGVQERLQYNKREQHDAIRGAELPSVVENEYAEQQPTVYKRRRRLIRLRQAMQTPVPSTKAERSSVRIVKSRSSPRTSAREREQRQQSDIPLRSTAALLETTKHVKIADHVRYKNRTISAQSERPTILARATPDMHRPLQHNGGVSTYGESTDAIEQLAPRFATSKHWTERKPDCPDLTTKTKVQQGSNDVITDWSAAKVAADVDQFFHLVFGSDLHEPDIHCYNWISDQLLRLALEVGTLDDIRSLIQWKTSVGMLSQYNLIQLRTHCSSLAARIDQESLLDFFINLLGMKSVIERPGNVNVKLALDVLSAALTWDLDLPHSTLASALTESTFSVVSKRDVSINVLTKCKRLLAEGDVQTAGALFASLDNYCAFGPAASRFLDGLFEQALVQGYMSTCAMILRWQSRRRLQTSKFSTMLNGFIAACAEKEAYVMLKAVFTRTPRDNTLGTVKWHKTYEEQLDGPLTSMSYARLCIACAGDSSSRAADLFARCYRSVLPCHRSMIHDADMALRLAALKSDWAATHDLQTIESRAQAAREWLTETDSALVELREVDLTMIEIYLSANKMDKAIQLLTRVNQASPKNMDVGLLAGLTFAKRRDWLSFDRLWPLLNRDTAPIRSQNGTRRFNNVLHLYSKDHDADATWRLASSAIEELGLRPNKVTLEIMLQCFVSKKTLASIPQWLRYLKALGHKVVLDARAAAALLKCFYLDFRPSHVLMMWFCHELVRLSPSIASERLVTIVREAIGFDLRNMDAAWLQVNANLRLERLDHAENQIPTPGYVYDKQLYFEHPDAKPCETNSAIDSPPAGIAQPLSNFASVESGTRPLTGSDVEDELPHPSTTSSQETDMHFIPSTPLDSKTEQSLPEVADALDDASDDAQEAVPSSSSVMLSQSSSPSTQPVNDREIREQLERDMILALSREEFQKVHTLYESSLDAAGIPLSPLTLEVAVQASLHAHKGSTEEANCIMDAAKAAGMNVTRAMGPLLIHQIRQLTSAQKRDVDTLRLNVINYYRMNHENGWPVKHHVGVTAAHAMITHGCPEHGVNLLEAIYRSEWASDRQLDIAAMTAWLEGYAIMRHGAGIHWVVKQVLNNNLRIDRAFLKTLHGARKHFAPRVPARVRYTQVSQSSIEKKVLANIERWKRMCQQRRLEQRLEAKRYGKELVRCIARCVDESKMEKTTGVVSP